MSFSTKTVTGKEDLIVSIPAVEDQGILSAGPTIEADLTGDPGSTTANILHWIEVDCRNAAVENGTFRMWEGTSNPTVGVTPAHVFVPGIRGQIKMYHAVHGSRWTIGQRMYAAYVKGIGGTGGSDAPTGKVIVRLGITVGVSP